MSTLGLALSLLLPGAAFAQEGPQKLPAITLTAGMHQIRAEVARTDLQRQIGLMHRSAMPAGENSCTVQDGAGSVSTPSTRVTCSIASACATRIDWLPSMVTVKSNRRFGLLL